MMANAGQWLRLAAAALLCATATAVVAAGGPNKDCALTSKCAAAAVRALWEPVQDEDAARSAPSSTAVDSVESAFDELAGPREARRKVAVAYVEDALRTQYIADPRARKELQRRQLSGEPLSARIADTAGCDGGSGSKGGERRAAVVLRGLTFRVGGAQGQGHANQLEVLDNYLKLLVSPLKERYGAVDVLLTVYKDHEFAFETHVKPFMRALQPASVTVLPQFGALQAHSSIVALAALKQYATVAGFTHDTIIFTRFDLLFKLPPIEAPMFDERRVSFAWKEIAGDWRERHPGQPAWTCDFFEGDGGRCRVPDTIHMLPGDLLPCFMQAVVEDWVMKNRNFAHEIAPLVADIVGRDRIGLLFDSYHDSNTDRGGIQNPLYDMQRVVKERPWWTDACAMQSDFVKDEKTGSLCCPMHTYCCPYSATDCSAPGTVKAKPRGKCAPRSPPSRLGGGGAYFSCPPGP